ncbi:VOC family protein [Agromyces sp. NPDC058484]|uniref:VOC family protein n=1 Tax=Agromyces sp. NPDC058484 TaxID=3346524 RepID=UPI00366950A1
MSDAFVLLPEHDIRNQHGAPGWHELTTDDPEAAAEFLRSTFGWDVVAAEIAGSPYWLILVSGHQVGGIRAPQPGDTAVPRWDTYITVEDVDTVASVANRAGAVPVVPPVDLGDEGRVTVFHHAAAGTVAAFQYPRPFS